MGYLQQDSGTHAHANSTSEQTVYEYTDGDSREIRGIWIDLTGLAQDSTVKAYYKIDATNYRELVSWSWTSSDGVGYFISVQWPIINDFKITLTSGTAEGAAVSLEYEVHYVDDVSVTIPGTGTQHTHSVDDALGNGIEGVFVEIYQTATMTGTAIRTGTTDSNGEIDFFLSAGTYYAAHYLAGYVFTNPTTVTVT